MTTSSKLNSLVVYGLTVITITVHQLAIAQPRPTPSPTPTPNYKAHTSKWKATEVASQNAVHFLTSSAGDESSFTLSVGQTKKITLMDRDQDRFVKLRTIDRTTSSPHAILIGSGSTDEIAIPLSNSGNSF